MSVQIIAMEGLPAKYKHFRVMMQRGGKVLTSGDLYADDEGKMIFDKDGNGLCPLVLWCICLCLPVFVSAYFDCTVLALSELCSCCD